MDTRENNQPFAVISDLGISKILSDSPVQIVKSFTIAKAQGASAAFASPEMFQRLSAQDQSATPKESKACDVYAFSITVWEMLCKQSAWSKKRNWSQIESEVVQGKRPEFPSDVMSSDNEIVNGLKRVIEGCWAQSIDERSVIDVARQELETIARDHAIDISVDTESSTVF